MNRIDEMRGLIDKVKHYTLISEQQQSSQQNNQIEKNIASTITQALDSVIKDMPNILKTVASELGDKDGIIDVPGVYKNDKQEQVQESEMDKIFEIKFDENKFQECMKEDLIKEAGFLSVALSAPVLISMAGKAASWTGKKMNANWLQKFGGKMSHFGEKIHHKYIGIIQKILTPLMPGASEKQVHKAAEIAMIGIIGVLFAGGLSNPSALEAVKAQEIASFAKSELPNILSKIGFS
jgi:hypothetical protein